MKVSGKRWWVLTVGMLAQVFTSMFQFGLPFLLPQLTSFAEGSAELGALLIAAPSVGLIASLLAWGWVADRFGERVAMVSGLLSGALVLGILSYQIAFRETLAFGAIWFLLFLASALLASVNSASARLILAWFPLRERGLAMGIRQTGQPFGVAAAAVVFPVVAAASGLHAALCVVGVGCFVAAVLIIFTVPGLGKAATPPKQATEERSSPYKRPELWRTHGASGFLTICQFVFSVFGFTFLIAQLGYEPVRAGAYLAAANLLGGALRILLGWASDRLLSRLRPLRWIAGVLVVVIGALAAVDYLVSSLGSGSVRPVVVLALLLACTALSASNNGLSFTLVAEYAGQHWTGRALGVQNTVQNLVAAAVPSIGTLVLGTIGFPGLFMVGALGAGAAALMLPRGNR